MDGSDEQKIVVNIIMHNFHENQLFHREGPYFFPSKRFLECFSILSSALFFQQDEKSLWR